MANRSLRNSVSFWFRSVAVTVAVVLPAAATAFCREKPNIVFVLVDDLGWMDLACQGNKLIDTPNIDGFAKQGMRFTDAYSAAPVCSPTRAAIMTGQSPARLHLTTHIPDRFVPRNAEWLPAATLNHLPLRHVTIAERLKQAGYATAFMGKWHLAGRCQSGGKTLEKTEFYPERQGFDINLGGCHLGGPPTYFDPYRIENLPNRRRGEYLPDRLADEAAAFMRAGRRKPFFLCLWHYTVHWPMEAKKQMLEKYAARKGPGLNDHRYGAMVECMDAAFGGILATLDELNLTGRTLVIFTSDNGGFSGVADNRPLRAGKGYLYEGGIRVPLIVRWPGIVPPGAVCREPVLSTDFYPTLLAAAGLRPDPNVPLDGENLMPLLRQSGRLARREIYFHFPNYAWHMQNRLGAVVREGPLKLIQHYDDGSVQLYNLVDDLGESSDLSAQMPDKAAELKRKLQAWLAASGAEMPKRREP